MKALSLLVFAYLSCPSLASENDDLKQVLLQMRLFADSNAYEEILQEAKKIETHEANLKKFADDSPEQAELYVRYHFYKLNAYAGMLDKDNALKEIALLNEYFDSYTSDQIREFNLNRFSALTAHLKVYVESWKGRDLDKVGRLMKLSSDRMNIAKGGSTTQAIQKEAIDILDELIKKEENSKGDGDGINSGEQGSSKGNKSPNPQDDSRPGDDRGAGKTLNRKLAEYAQNWGTLPEAARVQIMQEISRDIPSKYRAMVEEYFRQLNKTQPTRP